MLRFIFGTTFYSACASFVIGIALPPQGVAAAQSKDPRRGIEITNQTGQAVHDRVSHADDDRASSREVTLEPQKTHSYNEPRPLLCKFQSASRPLEYVLSPGRRYAFSADDAGNLNLSRTAAAGDGVTADVRELKVLVVADASYQKRFPNWSKRVRELISEVSNHFDDNFGIRLYVSECRVWDRFGPDDFVPFGQPWSQVPKGVFQVPVPANNRRNATTPLFELREVKSGQSDLVIGFTILQVPRSGQTVEVELGATTNFSQHVVIHESTQPQIAARAKGIVLHELCHAFGAFHLADPRSVMQPNIATAPRNVTVDEVTRQVIRLTRNMDLRKGVESLDEDTARKISQLYQAHHHPRSVDEDPIAVGYAYQASMAFEAGDTRRAKKMAYEVTRRTPRNFAAYMLIGAAALMDLNWKEATAAFTYAIYLRPKSAEAHAGLGFTSLLQADTRAALKEAEYALRIDPRSQAAKALRDACREVASDKEALEFLRKAAEPVAAAP